MARELVATGRAYESKVLHSAGVAVLGRLLYSSGLTSRDGPGNIVGVGDMAAQIAQVCQNLADVLAAAGSSFDRVVKYTIYTTDIDAWIAADKSGLDFMRGNPASTLIEVSRLAHPDLLVEIEMVAEID